MRQLLIAPLLCAIALPAAAQQAQVTIRTEKLAPGVAVLFGQGGNIGVSYGSDGTVLIDDQFAPLTPRIQAAVAELPATPVKFLINTHWHGDHSGGNENFGKAGAIIVAQEHVRERMAAGQMLRGQAVAASPAAALPVVTYPNSLSIHLNGDTVRTMHVPHAHTDGDSIVFWEKAKVVHMGDTFVSGGNFPFIDMESGGSAKGLVAAIGKVLAHIGDDAIVIPGHGPVGKKADLAAYHAMLTDVIGAVEKARKAGKTLEQIVAMKPAAKYDTNPGGFIKADGFVTAVFNSLEKPPAHKHGGDHHH
jgi:cyclase